MHYSSFDDCGNMYRQWSPWGPFPVGFPGPGGYPRAGGYPGQYCPGHSYGPYPDHGHQGHYPDHGHQGHYPGYGGPPGHGGGFPGHGGMPPWGQPRPDELDEMYYTQEMPNPEITSHTMHPFHNTEY